MLLTSCTNRNPKPQIDDSDSFVRVSERNSHYFELSNGHPYIPIGLNMIGPAKIGEPGLAQMEEWMRLLSENGGNYIRIWLGARFWNLEQTKAGEYDQRSFRRLDSLFAMARRHDIRLKMCLESFRSIHPDNVGKKGTFPLTMYHVSEGGPFHTMDEYINTEKGKEHFKAKLDWFYENYGSDPIVFGWELWNEMDAIVAKSWESWTEEMLKDLKVRFPENLVMQSLGSYDNIEKREMYRRINALPGNQVAQVHRYLDLGAQWNICHAPMDVLASDAVNEIISFNLDKPILLAETGGVEPSHSGPLKLYREDVDGMLLHDLLFAPFFSGAAGPGHTWHWSQYVVENNLWYHFDRFAQVVEGIDPASEDFKPNISEDDKFRSYVLSGDKTILIWIRDKNNTWESELKNKIQPETFPEFEFDLNYLGIDPEKKKIAIYDPWKNEWKTSKVKNEKIMLPSFSRSLILKAVR